MALHLIHLLKNKYINLNKILLFSSLTETYENELNSYQTQDEIYMTKKYEVTI